MRRLLFYVLKIVAFCCRLLSSKLYRKFIVLAHRSQGVCFEGMPEYIHTDAYLDASGGLTIADNVVISTKVIILSHDWLFLKRPSMADRDIAFRSVRIGRNSFIGAGAIILPGTVIGESCIVGAGAVVKGSVSDYAIVAGNPAKVIGDTRKLMIP